MKLDELLDQLEGVKRGGNGYIARCPLHADREPSLTVTESDGKILWHCQAGCDQDALTEKILGLVPKTTEPQEPEAVYRYVDAGGELIFESLRYKTARGKRFLYRHPDPTDDTADEDGWVWNMDDVPRTLYNLPKVIAAIAAAETVYVVEGEKDADSLNAIGKVATCNPMGAGKWRSEFSQFFVGYQGNVIVVADRDEPGRNHADAVRRSLEEIGAKVIVVQAKEGKDATDHLEAGHPVEDFKVLRTQRRGIVTAHDLAEHARERMEMTADDLPGYRIAPGTALDALVWRPGRMYAVGAYTGDGKTSLALQSLRALATAGKRVGYISLEMPEMDLMNKLVAHKGVPLLYTEEPWRMRNEPAVSQAYEEAINEIEKWNVEIVFDHNASAESIRERTMDREYEVIFVDHLHRVDARERKHLEAQVRGITNIALELNVLVVVLCQFRKTQRGNGLATYPKPSLQDFRETSQIGDDASMALAVWRQRDDSGLRYTGHTEVIVLKNRHTTGQKDAAGFTYMPTFDPNLQMFTPTGGVT